MLKLSELAQFLTDKLNEIAQNKVEKYNFLIHAEVGKNEPNKIGGILRTSEPTITPVNGIKNIKYNGSVKFAVPAPQSNFNLINIENIIGEFIETYNGKEIEFSKGKGLLTFTFSRAEDYKIEYKQGEMLPLLFGVMVNYTENMVTSGTKVWQIKPLDDENAEFLTIPYLSESILLEKSGKTSNISDALYQQTLLMSQIKFYRFEIPYETNNNLCSMLQKDILNGDFGKKYELRYYDGVSFLDEEGKDFRTTVSIYRTGDSSSRKPDTSIFNITFSDVDPGTNSIKYYMALVDNPFDSLSENTQYFESQEEQQEYFQELINEGADYDEIPAPNLNSLYLTSQVYINTRKYDIFNLINKNYAIIKATNGTWEKFFFYVVNNGDIGANGQVNYNLTMDTVQTFLINDELEIQGSFINKAHLNRWIEVDENTVQFNGNYDSDLFEREELKEVAKRLVARKKLKHYSFDEEDLELCEWLDDNIECWVYVYLNNGVAYKVIDSSNAEGTISLESLKYRNLGFVSDSRTVDYGYSVLCYPIFKSFSNNKIIARNENKEIWINSRAYNYFNIDNGAGNVYNIKLSLKPPFSIRETPYEIVNGDLIFNYYDFSTVRATLTQNLNIVSKFISFIRTTKDSGTYNDGLFYVTNDYVANQYFYYDLEKQLSFSKSTITNPNAVRNKNWNPKLLNEDYVELRTTFFGSSFNWSIQKLNTQKIIFSYHETMDSAITKGLLRLYTNYENYNENNVFNTAYGESFNGFSFTIDMGIPFSVSQYESYIANNKNAYLSFQNQQNLTMDKFTVRTINNAVDNVLNPVNAISGMKNMVVDAANTYLDLNYQATQFNLSMDNMRNAPDSLQNINGSSLLGIDISGFGIYAEIYEGLNVEMEMANDIMFRDGYNYNRFGEVKDFINIRKNFNYIKAILGNISGVPISEEARRNLKQRFASGIRFWNKNNDNKYVIDYTKENYERWLSPSQV